MDSTQWKRNRLPLSSLVLGGYDVERCNFQERNENIQKFNISLGEDSLHYFRIPKVTIGIKSPSREITIPFGDGDMIIDNVIRLYGFLNWIATNLQAF
jgi:hypothetical protein